MGEPLQSVEKLLDREQVAKRIGLAGPNTLDRWVREGLFKKPLKRGARFTRWTEGDVIEHLRQIQESR